MIPNHKNGDQETKIYAYLSRRNMMKLLGLSTFGMNLWISGCNQTNAGSALTGKAKKKGKMESNNSIATIKKKLPALDAAAPVETRTATFALG
jgi:hypothetical protein